MRYLWILSFLLLFVSCKKDDPIKERTEQAAIDEQLITDYLTENNIAASRLEVEYNYVKYGLYYVITKEGSGAHPNSGSLVEVYYKGSLLDGTVFDESDDLWSAYLPNMIPGWTYGVPLMRPGGKATFYIPSGLGYGTSGSGLIPANAILKFDITLVRYNYEF